MVSGDEDDEHLKDGDWGEMEPEGVHMAVRSLGLELTRMQLSKRWRLIAELGEGEHGGESV